MKRFFKRPTVRFLTGLIVILLLTSPVYFSKITSIDVWKNLVSGQYLFYFHQFPHPSTFTHAPVTDYVSGDVQDWLGSLILFVVVDQVGWIGLSSLKIVPVLIAAGVTWLLLKDQFGATFSLVGTLLIYLMMYRLAPRTTLFGLCSLPLVLFCWYQFAVERQRRFLWFIPLIFTVWSNLHGSFIIGGFVFAGAILGFLLDYTLRGTFSRQDLIVVLSTAALVLLGTTLVKPAPDGYLYNRLVGALGGSVPSKQISSTQPESNAETSSGLKGTLKTLSRGLFLQERPYVAPEFDFSLKKFVRTDDRLVFLILVPLFLLYVIIYGRDSPLSLTTGGFFALWIGLAFQRAVAYAGVTLTIWMFAEWLRLRTRLSINLGRVAKLSLHTVLSVSILFLFVWYVEISVITGNLEENLGLDEKLTWAYGWGKHPFFETDVPEKTLKSFPEYKSYNELSIGGLLLWEWWPYKKVFWWPKTSSYKHSILQKRVSGQITPEYLQENDLRLSVVSTRYVLHHNSVYEASADWSMIEQDQLLTVFCNCPADRTSR